MHEKSWTVETYKEAGRRVSGGRKQVNRAWFLCLLLPDTLLPAS
jgi:hypothetical protein